MESDRHPLKYYIASGYPSLEVSAFASIATVHSKMSPSTLCHPRVLPTGGRFYPLLAVFPAYPQHLTHNYVVPRTLSLIQSLEGGMRSQTEKP